MKSPIRQLLDRSAAAFEEARLEDREPEDVLGLDETAAVLCVATLVSNRLARRLGPNSLLSSLSC